MKFALHMNFGTVFKAKSQDIPVLSTSPWRCM